MLVKYGDPLKLKYILNLNPFLEFKESNDKELAWAKRKDKDLPYLYRLHIFLLVWMDITTC